MPYTAPTPEMIKAGEREKTAQLDAAERDYAVAKGMTHRSREQIRAAMFADFGVPCSTPTAPERVNHPSHYGGDTVYETIKVIEAWDLGFNIGNAVKYLSRAGRKAGVDAAEDYAKAIWYIQHEISRLTKET